MLINNSKKTKGKKPIIPSRIKKINKKGNENREPKHKKKGKKMKYVAHAITRRGKLKITANQSARGKKIMK